MFQIPLSVFFLSAAGFGTGFLPATKSRPKDILPVYDKPILQYAMEDAVASRINDILFITGETKGQSKTTSTSPMKSNTLCRRQVKTES